jgi:hypothetical protein
VRPSAASLASGEYERRRALKKEKKGGQVVTGVGFVEMFLIPPDPLSNYILLILLA